MKIIKNFINSEDLKTVQQYIETIIFNTKEEHVPLHDGLFSDEATLFDIHTRGEMPDYILEIFSKYSKGMYEIVQSEQEEKYHPPMFSKHYIARYRKGSLSAMHYANEKPEGTFGSYLIWKNADSGGKIHFPEFGQPFVANPGDLIYFEETKLNIHEITKVEDGYLFLSEAWMGKIGQLWMPNRVPYNEVEWNDWEIKGFYE